MHNPESVLVNETQKMLFGILRYKCITLSLLNDQTDLKSTIKTKKRENLRNENKRKQKDR